MLDFGFYNMDCMEGMKQFPDKYFDLAIVDPPYGINNGKASATDRIMRYGQLNTVNADRMTKEFFVELCRASKNQIIFGFNYLCDILPPTKEFIFWYKHQPVITYADGELAWTSFNSTAKCFDFPYHGGVGRDKERIHPTQKPVALYKWILKLYANKGDKILDTHVGSASSLIACYDMGFDYVGFEIDEEYYRQATKRIEEEKAQVRWTW